ncbi:MAG: PAS domain S-box protein [Deltaproteobacteria bacterium]|nr:PAS domain S-box protein [Deltaproteobacteria bacterium]
MAQPRPHRAPAGNEPASHWARAVVEATEDLVYVCSEDLTVVYMNPALIRRTGRDAIGERCHRVLHGLDDPCPWCVNSIVIGQNRSHTWEVQSPDDGRWYHVVNTPIEREGRRYKVAIIRDITARREAEAERERMALAVDQASDAIVIVDARGRVLSANPAYEAITGVPVEQARGRRLGTVLETADPDFDLEAAHRQLAETGRWRGRVTKRRPDGREVILDAAATNVRAEDGTFLHGVCIFRDVTREVEWERERARTDRLRALGTLAGGIAHDFNNLLMGILGSAELLESVVPPGDPGRRHLERILRAGERARALVAQILQFSRSDPSGVERADLRTEAEMAADLLRATTPSTVEVTVRVPDRPCPVPLDPAQAQQVVLNLATNAVKALGPRGGQVQIEVVTREFPEGDPGLPPDLSPGRYHRLAVSDTGCGMPPGILDRIFEPFFTTRPVGEGTGLGLSVVYGVVRAAGGALRVESEPGRGSLFEVFLPVEPRP